jgi:iron(III) transport system substrate-binding protein
MAVAVTSFTNVSPAAAQRSSGTEAGLSIIEAEICFRRAQSNRRKSKENSQRPRSAARVHQRPAAKDRMRRRNRRRREDGLSGFANSVLSAGLFGLALSLIPSGWTPAQAQGAPTGASPSRPWLDPAVLAAAQAEGSLIVYSSTNEQEGLPLFKLFTDATGIKVEYVRASDAILMSRMSIEFRADQKSYDILQTATINKMPLQMLAAYEPPEAANISADARDPNKRWYGVYANYNAPAYNTAKVKASELPNSYEEFAQRKEWAGKVALDGTDNEWLKAIVQYYGEQKGVDLVKAIVAALRPVVTDGHLALARATGAGEYWVSLNNYVNLSMNMKLAGNPIDVWALDPVTLFFGQVGVNAKAPHPNAARLAANFMLSQECQQFLAKFGRLPTRKDVPSNPPGVTEMLTQKKVITVLMSPDEERKWQRQFDQLFKGR